MCVWLRLWLWISILFGKCKISLLSSYRIPFTFMPDKWCPKIYVTHSAKSASVLWVDAQMPMPKYRMDRVVQCYAAKCCHFHTMATAHKKLWKRRNWRKTGDSVSRCRRHSTNVSVHSHRCRRGRTPLRVIERSKRNKNERKEEKSSADYGTSYRLPINTHTTIEVQVTHARMLRDVERVRDCERAMYLEKGT